MAQVFLSYSHDDSLWVGQIEDALARRGLVVWVDKSDIPPSVAWRAEVRDAIEGSHVVVACRSVGFAQSKNCAEEIELAGLFGRQIVSVAVGGSVEVAASAVAAYAANLDARTLQSVELVARTREWIRRGKDRTGLIRGQTLRALESHARSHPVDVDQAKFLSRSRQVSNRRIRRTVTTIVVLILLARLPSALGLVPETVADTTTTQIANLNELTAAEQALATDPYLALEAVKDFGRDEAGARGEALGQALANPTPVDAFEIAGAEAFVGLTVDQDVLIRDTQGGIWSRSASDETALPELFDTQDGGLPAVADDQVVVRIGVGMVELALESLPSVNSVHVRGVPSAVAPSPDERLLAVAIGNRIDIVDIEQDRTIAGLAGAVDDIEDVVWSTEGDMVWAVAGDRVVAWRQRSGTYLLNEPGREYRGLSRSAIDAHLWVVAKDGRLLHLNTAVGAIVDEIVVDDELQLASGSVDGRHLVAIGDSAVHLVDLVRGDVSELDIAERCRSTPAFIPDGETFYLACTSVVLGFDATTGSEVERIPVSTFVSAVAVDPRDGSLVAAGQIGELSRWTDGRWQTPRNDIGLVCPATTLAMAVSPAGDVVYAGESTGQFYCTVVVRTDQGPDYQWGSNRHVTPSGRSRAVTFVLDGTAMVHGYSDGSIVIWPHDHFDPEVRMVESVGDVWGLLEIDGVLYIATRSGVVAGVPLPEKAPTNRALAEVVADRLETAQRLGLADTG